MRRAAGREVFTACRGPGIQQVAAALGPCRRVCAERREGGAGARPEEGCRMPLLSKKGIQAGSRNQAPRGRGHLQMRDRAHHYTFRDSPRDTCTSRPLPTRRQQIEWQTAHRQTDRLSQLAATPSCRSRPRGARGGAGHPAHRHYSEASEASNTYTHPSLLLGAQNPVGLAGSPLPLGGGWDGAALGTRGNAPIDRVRA